MTCASCVGNVERAIRDGVPGVRWAKVCVYVCMCF